MEKDNHNPTPPERPGLADTSGVALAKPEATPGRLELTAAM